MDKYFLKIITFLASSDVISLFSSLNIDDVIRYIFSLFDDNPSLTEDIKKSQKATLNIIVYSNIFIYKGVTYRQIHGIPSSSSVSILFAEFALRTLVWKTGF